MKSVCVYFQVHQPNRLKQYSFFDIGKDHFYEDDLLNEQVLHKVSDKCYLPANAMFLDLIQKHSGQFKIAYSLSGVLIEQLEQHRPDVLESFKALANTGCVEFLSETYYHSLSYLYSKEEFERQIEIHKERIQRHFGQTPKVFRNTELIYNNDLAEYIEGMGFNGILSEGVNWFLNGRTPNVLYRAPKSNKIKVLLKNHKLSDDVAFRFSNTAWVDYPLTPLKFTNWIMEEEGDVVNLFMDYETIGEHHWVETGIFDFWSSLPDVLLKSGLALKTPSEVINSYKVKDQYDVHESISWADSERDLSAWLGNTMQSEAVRKIYQLEKAVLQSKNIGLVHVWRKLQTSDHFYYMCTKYFGDGAVHDYFSPYASPYDGYIYFMNAVSDLEIMLRKEGIEV